jgi:hypothetical protein
MKILHGKTCPYCRKPMTYEARPSQDIDKQPAPGSLTMCVHCVCLALCRMTVLLHGDIGEWPASNLHEGHEQREKALARRAYFSQPLFTDGVPQ